MKPIENIEVLELEIIATKDGKHYISYMNSNEWLNLKKKKGWSYRAFQKGFSQYKIK